MSFSIRVATLESCFSTHFSTAVTGPERSWKADLTRSIGLKSGVGALEGAMATLSRDFGYQYWSVASMHWPAP